MKFNDKGIMVEKRNQPVNFFKKIQNVMFPILAGLNIRM